MTPDEVKKHRAGNALRVFVDKHFATYKDFAETVGERGGTVSSWMTGKRKIPARLIQKLGELFPDDIKTFKKIMPDLF
jgi:plasmid maintenance system antidote protein VapI